MRHMDNQEPSDAIAPLVTMCLDIRDHYRQPRFRFQPRHLSNFWPQPIEHLRHFTLSPHHGWARMLLYRHSVPAMPRLEQPERRFSKRSRRHARNRHRRDDPGTNLLAAFVLPLGIGYPWYMALATLETPQCPTGPNLRLDEARSRLQD